MRIEVSSMPMCLAGKDWHGEKVERRHSFVFGVVKRLLRSYSAWSLEHISLMWHQKVKQVFRTWWPSKYGITTHKSSCSTVSNVFLKSMKLWKKLCSYRVLSSGWDNWTSSKLTFHPVQNQPVLIVTVPQQTDRLTWSSITGLWPVSYKSEEEDLRGWIREESLAMRESEPWGVCGE